jgi:hypothetical protein
MGQYFTPVFLNSTGSIVHALNPADYGSGDKLAGNTRADMPLMHATQVLLSLDGALRLVWAGDNADDEPNGDPSLYFGVQPHHFVRIAELLHRDCREAPNMSLPDPERRNVFGVVCNEDMHEFIDHVSLPIDDTGWRRRGPGIGHVGARPALLPPAAARRRLGRRHRHLVDIGSGQPLTQVGRAPFFFRLRDNLFGRGRPMNP